MFSEIFSLFGSVEALRERASSGDVEAQYRMGRMYEDGRRVVRDEETAVQWYNRAADRGHGAAQYRLGLMYASGRGVARDSAKALRWLRLAAEQNVAGARLVLEQVEIEAAAEAEAGWRGRSRAARPEPEARRAGRRAAREAPPLPISRAKIVFAIIAIVFLINAGMIFFAIDRHDRFMRTQPAQAPPARTRRPGPSATAAHYLALAHKGDVNAMFRVARMYDRGSDGMPQDDERAVFWYRQGAARGHALSLYCLGWMHEQGRGVPKDMEEALQWYRQAEAAGYKGATDRLEELERRRKLESQEAEQGDAEDLYRRGLRHEQGTDGPIDYGPAAFWYRQAAQQGHGAAQFALGRFHEAGLGGLPQDDAQALYWYRRSAERGNADAQHVLGWKYEKGLGVAQDEEQALEWYRKSAANGSNWGRHLLEELEKRRAER